MNGNSGQFDSKVNGNSGHRYARIPEGVLCDQRISAVARLAYGVLAMHVWQGTVARLGQRRIAALLGVHQETVSGAVSELIEAGHVIANGERGHRRTYILTSPVFGKKAGKVKEVVSSPSGGKRLATVEKVA